MRACSINLAAVTMHVRIRRYSRNLRRTLPGRWQSAMAATRILRAGMSATSTAGNVTARTAPRRSVYGCAKNTGQSKRLIRRGTWNFGDIPSMTGMKWYFRTPFPMALAMIKQHLRVCQLTIAVLIPTACLPISPWSATQSVNMTVKHRSQQT